jgi:uncharacterized protein
MNRRRWMMLSGSVLALRAGSAQNRPDPAGAAEAPKGISPDKLLLKDYRPQSIYKVPVTHIQKARYPVIDAHCHAEWTRSADNLDAKVKLMDAAGIEKTVLFVRAGTPDAFTGAAALFSKYPDRFDLWCNFDLKGYTESGFAERTVKSLEGCRRAGALGIGEISDKGKGLAGATPTLSASPRGGGSGLHPDDPRMDVLYEKCAQLGMPINIHVSDPIWSYQMQDNTNDGLMNGYTWAIKVEPGVLGHDELIGSLERAVAKHRKTIFIACHLANLEYDLNRLGGMFDRNPNLYADLGARFAEASPIARFVSQFFRKYPDRILYGTDMIYNQAMFSATFRILESFDEHFYIWDKDVQETTGAFYYHWPLYGMGLADDLLKRIYSDNARAAFGKARGNAA